MISLKKIWTKSIARQLMLGIALVHAVMMTIFVIDLVAREKKFLVGLSEKQAIGLAETLATNGISWILAQDVIGMEEIINSQSGFPGLKYAMFLDTKGKVLAYSDMEQVGRYIADEVSKTLLTAPPKTYFLVNTSCCIDIAAPILAHGKQVGWARVGISRAGITDNIRQAIQNGLIYTLVAIGVGTIFAWFMARSLTTDIRQLVTCANRAKDGERDVDFELDREDELGEMATNFQRLNETLFVQLETLQQEIEAKKTAEHNRIIAEESLLEEKERLAVTLRSIGDGVITTDLESKIVLINRVTERLTGWSQSEAVGRPVMEVFNIINEKTGMSCANPVDKVLSSGEIISLANHTVLISRDGTRHVIEDSGAPICDKDSKLIGSVLVFRDVTAKKNIAKELLKVKKLESVGVLAGGIAHDFNNILAAILGNIELATVFIPAENEAYPLLQEAKKASIRAKDLTQQLLTFSKGGEPVKKTSPIGTTIVDSANFVLHGSSVLCTFDIPDDLAMVEIDAGQISQVIQNLVLNAKHAMPDGGEIKINCCNISDINAELSVSLPPQAYIRITVRDEGCGIVDKYLDKIFDPYFSTKQEGSGLGLAVSYSIINKHNGHIDVQSVVGEGAAFHIYLPATTLSCPLPKPVILGAGAIQANILVMDDDLLVRDIATKMLRHLGHEPILAPDGAGTLALYQKYLESEDPIDLVIMDLTIPGGMGGKEAIRALLQIDPEARVIVSSGYSNDPVMAHYEEYGFKAAIAKPFEMEELQKVIFRVLG